MFPINWSPQFLDLGANRVTSKYNRFGTSAKKGELIFQDIP